MKILPLPGPFHFIGIGGSGMSPLAEILRAQGHEVSGSDEKASDTTTRLAAMGVRIHQGHDANNVSGARCLVLSSAIKDSNPELMAGRALGLRLVHRGDLLDAVMAPFGQRIAVSGSHGKTTTTAMVTGILETAGFDPTALVGGKFKGSQSGARVGEGDVFVAEADESDRSFLKLHPTLSLVTNVDREHLDTYEDMAEVTAAFTTFALGVPEHGAAVLCADDPIAAAIAKGGGKRSLTYGLSGDADVHGRIVAQEGGFPRVTGAGPTGDFDFTLSVSGEMNALNAVGAMAAAMSLGIAPALASRSLASFRGVARRLEWKGRKNGVDVWDDYGHHPTEIAATLKALRARSGGRRLVTLFQPHRVTRTRSLWDEFTEAFSMTDELWLANIYAAGESPETGITAERLATAIAAKGLSARFAGSLEEARANVFPHLQENDVFLTLGAGNVVDVGESFLSSGSPRA
ncbi:MAG: UDP-N-acetylmuramate--L-alanine ligase [Vicinamibacteria bacterium]